MDADGGRYPDHQRHGSDDRLYLRFQVTVVQLQDVHQARRHAAGRDQHRRPCVLGLQRPDVRDNSGWCDQHRRRCIQWLHRADVCDDPGQRDQRWTRCVLQLQQPDGYLLWRVWHGLAEAGREHSDECHGAFQGQHLWQGRLWYQCDVGTDR